MTATPKPSEPAAKSRRTRVSRTHGYAAPRRGRSEAAQDREDAKALNRALDAQEAGELETVSHAELKARLGLD